MKTINFIIIILTVISCSELKVPQNAKREYQLGAYLWYQNSGEFKALCYQAYNIGKLRLVEELKKTHTKKPAVVLDIDETVLDNSVSGAIELRENVGWSRESFEKWVSLKKAVLIAGAKDFIDYARSRNVQIIFISDRYVSHINDTYDNFTNLGLVTDKANFYFLEKGRNKEMRRQEVLSKFDVLLYFGDNLRDFDKDWDGKTSEERRNLVNLRAKEFGDKFIVLPNPLYGDWENSLPKVKSRYENLKSNF